MRTRLLRTGSPNWGPRYVSVVPIGSESVLDHVTVQVPWSSQVFSRLNGRSDEDAAAGMVSASETASAASAGRIRLIGTPFLIGRPAVATGSGEMRALRSWVRKRPQRSASEARPEPRPFR